jgi:hypothetical protein
MVTLGRAKTEAIMSQPTFDAFGEPVPATGSRIAQPSKSTGSVGIWLFWGLVGLIVLARAVLFEHGYISFERSVAWIQLFASL